MDYTDAQTAGVGAITALGERGLAIFLAAIVLAGSVFLIRWGFKSGKNALDGNVGMEEPKNYLYKNYDRNFDKGDRDEFNAYVRGDSLFRKEGFTFND